MLNRRVKIAYGFYKGLFGTIVSVRQTAKGNLFVVRIDDERDPQPFHESELEFLINL